MKPKGDSTVQHYPMSRLRTLPEVHATLGKEIRPILLAYCVETMSMKKRSKCGPPSKWLLTHADTDLLTHDMTPQAAFS